MDIYTTAGSKLAELVAKVWASEEAMVSWFKGKLPLDLDRTTRAKLLVTFLVEEAIVSSGINKGSITHKDRLETVQKAKDLIGDFNIYTQIRLNIQEGSPTFNLEKMEEHLKDYQEKYASVTDSPFVKKAKYRAPEDEDSNTFNAALALSKNVKIASEMQRGTNSYRVTPIGRTPALTDENNLSSMSLLAMTPYLQGAGLYIFDWIPVLDSISAHETPDGFLANGLKYPIVSESGGDILRKAIASRYLTSILIDEPSVVHIVPRYESLLVLFTEAPAALLRLTEKGLLHPYVKTT